jgi:hypothetical protein
MKHLFAALCIIAFATPVSAAQLHICSQSGSSMPAWCEDHEPARSSLSKAKRTVSKPDKPGKPDSRDGDVTGRHTSHDGDKHGGMGKRK